MKTLSVKLQKKQSDRRRYLGLKEAGICVTCGKIPPIGTRVQCRACIDMSRLNPAKSSRKSVDSWAEDLARQIEWQENLHDDDWGL